MHGQGKRLGNLTFSFNKSRNDLDFVPVNENHRQLRGNYNLRSRQLITDENNNLEDLFKRARDNSANTSFEEPEPTTVFTSNETNGDSRQFDLHRDVTDGDVSQDSNQLIDSNDSYESNYVNQVYDETVTSEVPLHSNNHQNKISGQQYGNNNVSNSLKKVHFDLNVTKFHEEQNSDECYPQTIANANHQQQQNGVSSNEQHGEPMLQNWVPKSKAAKGLMIEELKLKQERLNEKELNVYKQIESKESNTSRQIFNKSENIDLRGINMSKKSQQKPRKKDYINEMYKSTLKPNHSHPIMSSPTVFQRKLTVSMNKSDEMRNELIIDQNQDTGRKSKYYTQATEGLISYDALKVEYSREYKKAWPKRFGRQSDDCRPNGFVDVDVSHPKVIDDSNAKHSSPVTKHYSHSQMSKKSIQHSKPMNQTIHKNIKNLNFHGENRLNSYYKVSSSNVSTSKGLRRNEEKNIVKKNINDKSFLTSTNMYENQDEKEAKDFAYNKMIRRNYSEGGSSLDDGYSSASGSNRTGFSDTNMMMNSINEPNDSFISSLTDKVNFDSNNIEPQQQESDIRTSSTQRQNELIQEVSDFDYLPNEPKSYNNKSEQQQEKKESIHSKLEDMLKRQKSSQEKPKSRPNSMKFPDPLLADSIDETDSTVKKVDASFHDDSTSTSSSVKRKVPPPEHDDYNFGNNKRSLINELSRTISRRQSITADPIAEEFLQRQSQKQEEFLQRQSQSSSSHHQKNDQFGRNGHVESPDLELPDDFLNHHDDQTDFPPPPNLYDMFPLPNDQDNPSEQLLEERILKSKELPDEEPINVNAVATMLKSHLKDKQKENRTKTKRVRNEKKFVFTSEDLMQRDTTLETTSHQQKSPTKLDLVFANDTTNHNDDFQMDISQEMDELSHRQKRLSLEYEASEFSKVSGENIPPQQQQKQQQHSSVFDPASFSLTESDLLDAKKDLPFIKPEPLQSRSSRPVVSRHESVTNVPPLSLAPDMEDKIDEVLHQSLSKKITKDVSNNDGSQSNMTVEEQQTATKLHDQHEEHEEVKRNQPVNIHQRSFQSQESHNDFYLPENNDEILIKPSQYRIHKFKDRSRFRDPNPQPQYAELKIDSSRLTESPNVNRPVIKRVEKRHAPPQPMKSQVSDEAFRKHRVDRIGSEFISNDKPSMKKEHDNKTDRYAWENKPYIPLSVGKVNIPTTFQDKEGKSLEESPRPSAAKKTRAYRDPNNKISTSANGSRPGTPKKLNSKIKQVFSPKITRKHKSSSLDSIPLGLSSSRTTSTVVWGFSDDEASLNGSLASSDYYMHDDEIDTNFISDEEWIDSMRNSPNTSKTPSYDNTPRDGQIPHIKAPLMPRTKLTKQSNRTQKHVGRVIVPDVFSNQYQNGVVDEPQGKTTHRQYTDDDLLSSKVDDKYNIKLLTSDVAFNSFDINASMRRMKKERKQDIRKHEPIVIRKR